MTASKRDCCKVISHGSNLRPVEEQAHEPHLASEKHLHLVALQSDSDGRRSTDLVRVLTQDAPRFSEGEVDHWLQVQGAHW